MLRKSHVKPPSPPMNLSVIAADNGSVILEWNPPRDNGAMMEQTSLTTKSSSTHLKY